MTGVPDAAVLAAVEGRRSIRAFLPAPVPRETIVAILAAAARAPSGSNTQPWQVSVLTGAVKARVEAALLAAHAAGGDGHQAEYAYYPETWREPYLGRRRKVGWDLYATLGIQRGDGARMQAQHGRNYSFFGAPVGLIFTVDRDLGRGSWLDYGFFLEAIAVAARAWGLDTCAQAAFAQYPRILQAELGIPAGQMVVCGMALGHADPDAPENALVTERAPVEEWVRFFDGEQPAAV